MLQIEIPSQRKIFIQSWHLDENPR